MRCEKCGNEFEGKFCPNCGQAVNAPVQVAQPVQPQVIINNTNSLSIEMCGTAGDGSRQAGEAALENAAALGRELMKKYGIPLEHVYRHFDVTGKRCPAYLVEDHAWTAFKRRLAMDNTPAPAHKEGVDWAVQNGILLGGADGDLMLSQPVTREQMCTLLLRFMHILEE